MYIKTKTIIEDRHTIEFDPSGQKTLGHTIDLMLTDMLERGDEGAARPFGIEVEFTEADMHAMCDLRRQGRKSKRAD